MVTTVNNKIRFDLAIAISASLVFATRLFDRIIMLIARPYLLRYCDGIIHKTIAIDSATIAYIALYSQIYYIGVFHLLFLAGAVIVFINKKYRPFKRELFYAYLIIAVADILLNQIHHLLKIKS